MRYAVLGALFVLVVLFWSFIRKHTFTLLEPIVVGSAHLKQTFTIFPEFFGTYITSHETLVAERKALSLHIEELENKVAEDDALLREYKEKADNASSSLTSSIKTPILVYPLVQDITRLYSTVLLSKGYKDGLDIGNIVYLRGKQAVCSIKEVYKSSSLCLLFTSFGVTIEGVTSSSSITLTLVGRGGHYLSDIVRDTPVSVGEKVYMRSNSHMVLGTVKAVINNNQDTSWHIFVEGAYNPVTSSIFYVEP